MKLLGTLEEWRTQYPGIPVTNKKFLQPGTAITDIHFHENKVRVTYPIGHRPGDYDDTDNLHTRPMIYFGNQGPYIVSGEFNYTAGVFYYPGGCGGMYPISDDMVRDPNWERYEVEDYYQDERNK